jgi:hypothetical protein
VNTPDCRAAPPVGFHAQHRHVAKAVFGQERRFAHIMNRFRNIGEIIAQIRNRPDPFLMLGHIGQFH